VHRLRVSSPVALKRGGGEEERKTVKSAKALDSKSKFDSTMRIYLDMKKPAR
jgi:hypothetical protein